MTETSGSGAPRPAGPACPVPARRKSLAALSAIVSAALVVTIACAPAPAAWPASGPGSTPAPSPTARTAAPAGAKPLPPASALPQDGELELKAYAAAYPERVQDLGLRSGDWAIQVGDTWFRWAGGRLLPEGANYGGEGDAAWAPIRFYVYPEGLPPPPEPDPERTAATARRFKDQEENPPNRSESFFEALYEAHDEASMDAQIVRLDFLGRGVRVHRLISGRVEAVERHIEAAAAKDPAIKRFLSTLRWSYGYLWRDIAGTTSRSYHAYGLAIDLVPRAYGGKEFYWRDTQYFDDEWYALPYERRWMIPQPIVEAFEAEGFIWGGKWFSFDTVHFEYRPELLAYRALVQRSGAEARP